MNNTSNHNPEICGTSLVWDPEKGQWVERPGNQARRDASTTPNIIGVVRAYNAENMPLPPDILNAINNNRAYRLTDYAIYIGQSNSRRPARPTPSRQTGQGAFSGRNPDMGDRS